MKGSRFSEEQIIGILREQEAGATTADVCRKHGISEATFYKWKAKFGGLEVSDAKRLKTLEDENGKLKKLLAEAMLDIAVLKDINSRKWCRPPPNGRPWLMRAGDYAHKGAYAKTHHWITRLLHWATATLFVYAIIRNAEITGALFDAQQLQSQVIFSIVLSAVLVVQFVWIQFWGDGHDFLPMRPAWNVMHHEPCMY